MDAFQGNLNASLPSTILSGTKISDFGCFCMLLIDLSINIKVSSNEIVDQSNLHMTACGCLVLARMAALFCPCA